MEKGNLIVKMQALNRTTAKRPQNRLLKILQFGGGNFLRAFVDWMVQVLNETTDFNGGVAVIKPTARGDYHELTAQDGLFTVILDGIKNGELVEERTLVDCVQQVVNPYSSWEDYLAMAHDPDMRFVVSNTTEAGIKFNTADSFNDRPPIEFPAKLTRWLYHRFEHFNGDPTKGCIVLPCELIEENGEALKKAVLQYIDHWNLDRDFKNWISTANHFYNTLVDRIVSGYPTDRADKIVDELGFKDGLLVAGEYYHSWVVQGNEVVQKEIPFHRTNLNVEFVEDLNPYREMKVRLLNGAHTTMVPVGYLAGIHSVSEAMKDPLVANYIVSFLKEEVSKTLDFPEAALQEYIDAVLDRFRNPLLKHRLISISLNSTSKFVARLLPTLKDYYTKKGNLPDKLVFGLSALIRFYKGSHNGKKIAVKDDQSVLDFFQATYGKLDAGQLTLAQAIALILGNTAIWGEDLSEIEGLADAVVVNIRNIEKDGIRACLEEQKV